MVERINELLDAKGVSAATMLSEAGLARGSLSEWKKGKSKPGSDAVLKMAEYFDVTTDYLFGRTDIKEPVKTPGKKKDSPHLQKCLKIMAPMFKRAHNHGKDPFRGIKSKNYLAAQEEILFKRHEAFVGLLVEAEISREQLHEWSVQSNSDEPSYSVMPTVRQLRTIFSFCLEHARDITDTRFTFDWDAIETAIADYAYYSGLIEQGTSIDDKTKPPSVRRAEEFLLATLVDSGLADEDGELTDGALQAISEFLTSNAGTLKKLIDKG